MTKSVKDIKKDFDKKQEELRQQEIETKKAESLFGEFNSSFNTPEAMET
jgi:DNA-binding protein YbaB